MCDYCAKPLAEIQTPAKRVRLCMHAVIRLMCAGIVIREAVR